MAIDFSTEYSQRSDDELLHLASDRASLTTGSAIALDAELRRRNLTESDLVEYQRFVKRQEQRESRARRRKLFGTLKARFTWVDLLLALVAMAMISLVYVALPSRYHLRSDWQDAAFYVMLASVGIVFTGRSIFWRESLFWTSWVISSVIHLLVVHAWTQRAILSRGQGKGAVVLGFFLFFAVYGVASLLRRNFFSIGAHDNS